MKKKFFFIIIISLTFFSIPNFTYADSSASAVYQLFINDLAKNHGTEYSDYLSNKNAIIMDCREFANFDYYFISDYSTLYNSVYNRRFLSNNQPTIDYIFVNFPHQIYHRNENTSKTISGTRIYTSQTLLCNNPNMDKFLISALKSDGTISIYNFTPNMAQHFFFNSGINPIWSDNTIYEENSQIIFFPASTAFLNPSNFTYSGDETPNTTYQKIMAWVNANQNFYGNLWAEGPKPTIAIFKNNNNIVANLINSNNILANEYIAVFSSDRLCEYDQNNNSEHYNLFTYNNNKIFYFIFDTGTNNCNFYFMGSKNSQSDVLTVTNLNSNALIYCNSNIVKKSSSSQFLLNNDNSHVYFYNSPLEDSPLYPFNNNGNTTSTGESSSIWTEDDILGINDKLDDNVSFLDSILSSINSKWNLFWDVANDFLATSLNSLMTNLRQIIGINYITDILNYIKNLKSLAIDYKNSILLNNGIDLSFVFLNSTITFNPFQFFFQHLYAYFYRVSNLLFLVYMCLFFYRKTYKILNKNSDS